MTAPFIIYALPRSRTYWLSRFLTYGDYTCGHDQARYVRSVCDVRAWLSQDYTGTVETAAAPWWRMVQEIRPDIKTVVVRRDVDEVADSLLRLDLRGLYFDRSKLMPHLRRLDAKLDQISARVPNVLQVGFSNLAQEGVCASVFEYCLPYRHNSRWWSDLSANNLQVNMPSMIRYMQANDEATRNAAVLCGRKIKATMLNRVRFGRPDDSGISIQEENYQTAWRDGADLFAEHCVEVGEPPESYLLKNVPLFEKLADSGAWLIVTARCNGRMLGYISNLVGPSMDDRKKVSLTQMSIFVSRDAEKSNLPMKMQRVVIEKAAARGVNEIFFRAGVRGAGPRIDVIFRRLGAQDHGQLYRLDLEAA